MNTHAGYSKKTLTDTNVLLAGGGDKSLADFLGGIQYVSASNKILYRAADTNTWSDLVTLVMTDENVKQTPKTDNVNRPLMMINGGTSTGTLTSTSIFSTGIYANASTKMITANGFVKANSDSSHVLLGDGGHKDLEDFSMAHSHPYSYLHLSDWDYNTAHNSNYVTFDKSNGNGGPTSAWYNGFVTTHNNYLSSYLVNEHRTHNWYLGWNLNSETARWTKVLTADNTNINNGVITINGVTITPLTSHQSLANYVTLVDKTDDTTDHWGQLRYVKNGISYYFTVPYATTAGSVLNSSVSKSGETLTVKINGITQSLTNTWRGITNDYNPTTPSDSTSLSLTGAKNLYTALLNGPANSLNCTKQISVTPGAMTAWTWYNTGIAGSTLSSGIYLLRISINTNSPFWSCNFVGLLYWFKDVTNATEDDEIYMHSAGHANNDDVHLYIRTLKRASSTLTLLMCSNINLSSYTYTFRFFYMGN